MRPPWLSVIIPTYNGEEYLRSALESVVAQRLERIEVIAIDDASTDSTVGILESFAPRLPLTIVRRAHTGNWVSATNVGLSAARGDYVSFLHQDDLWSPNRLRALAGVAAKVPAAALVLHPSWFIDRQGRRVGHWRCPLPPNTELHEDLVRERLLVQNFIAIPAPLFRRDAALKVGGLDENLWYSGDWDFWLKIVGEGPTVYVPELLASFRIYSESQTMTRSVAASDFRQQLENVLERHLAARSVEPGVRRAAQFSVNVNAALAARAHRQPSSLSALALEFVLLGPAGWHRYTRDSRIVERALARVRIGLTPRSA
jgi:glycosyltransferase involved in cell wall biosynthesis